MSLIGLAVQSGGRFGSEESSWTTCAALCGIGHTIHCYCRVRLTGSNGSSARFPEALGRIYGYERPRGAKNWPQWMGAILKNDFYGRLNPALPDLPEELDNRNPVLASGYRDHKHHQDLTEEMGLPMLMERMGRFTMLLKMSKDPRDFRRNLFRHMPKRGDQGGFDP